MWLALLTEIAGCLHERLALANKRAEMATNDADKKAAIDEGLIVADTFQKMITKLKGMVHELNDAPVGIPAGPK